MRFGFYRYEEDNTECLFIALKGANFNGNQFAEKALEQGAKYVIMDEKEFDKSEKYILVEDWPDGPSTTGQLSPKTA